jgi:hypothetical protein
MKNYFFGYGDGIIYSMFATSKRQLLKIINQKGMAKPEWID